MSVHSKTRAMLILAFALALAAGASLGIVVAHQKPAPEAAPEIRPSSSNWLDLSPAQQTEIEKLGAQFSVEYQKLGDLRKAAASDRDIAVRNLLTPEKQPLYDKAISNFQDRIAVINKDRDLIRERWLGEYRKLLNPEQLKKYNESMERRRANEARRNAATRSTTRQTTLPAATSPGEGK